MPPSPPAEKATPLVLTRESRPSAARVHHAARRRGGSSAACGARTKKPSLESFKGDNNLVALGTPARWLAESKMKSLLLAAAAVAVLSIGANGRDDRLPANFVGDWCFAEHTADHLAFYRRGRCANPDNVDDWLTINPDRFDIHELHCQVVVSRATERGEQLARLRCD